jgi:Cwf15/Cwc15 cell cycle control protein
MTRKTTQLRYYASWKRSSVSDSKRQSEREDEIALGNPLLNLENAIRNQNGGGGAGGMTDSQPSFSVKRRWDDGE